MIHTRLAKCHSSEHDFERSFGRGGHDERSLYLIKEMSEE